MTEPQETYLCPNCGIGQMETFYSVDGTPVHSVLLMESEDAALSYPKGEIVLGFCPHCGFVSNVAFKPELHEYSQRYESTQSYSPTFTAFNRKLAAGLIERYDLRGKTVVEIGCGQGEFLVLLNELGDNRGIGFDPAYDGRLPESVGNPDLTFITDFYTEKQTGYKGDFFCCKMTLEHISNTGEFMRTVRRAIGEQLETTVFFQIPNGGYVLKDLAFWDIYYEHCSYFTAGSLRYLFENNGFEVLDTFTDYNDQYLMIEARPIAPAAGEIEASPEPLADTVKLVDYFVDNVQVKLEYWRHKLVDFHADGRRAVIWGSGSKGVAFLTTLKLTDEIGYAVDINPNRHGTFMTGTGHEIVGPEFLVDYRPELVIVMNPIYCPEIERDLNRLGLHPELVSV